MMKKCLLLACFIPLFAQAQKIVENKIDDFTHDSVRVTSWDPLVNTFGPNMKMRTRVSAVGENLFLGVALVRSGPDMEMTEGASLMFRTEGGKIITLRNSKDQFSCTGCAARGIYGAEAPGLLLLFPVSRDDMRVLAAQRVAAVRIDLADGYWEHDVKNKLAEKLQKQIGLIH
jgi:hypothetical protein